MCVMWPSSSVTDGLSCTATHHNKSSRATGRRHMATFALPAVTHPQPSPQIVHCVHYGIYFRIVKTFVTEKLRKIAVMGQCPRRWWASRRGRIKRIWRAARRFSCCFLSAERRAAHEFERGIVVLLGKHSEFLNKHRCDDATLMPLDGRCSCVTLAATDHLTTSDPRRMCVHHPTAPRRGACQ